MLPAYQIARLAIQGFAQSFEHRAGNARERAPLRHSVNGRMLHIEHTRQFKRRHPSIGQHLAKPPFNRHGLNVAATEHDYKLTLAICSRNGYISGTKHSGRNRHMAFRVQRKTIAVVHVKGQLVADNRVEFRAFVQEEVDWGVRRLTIDLSKCGYIDTSGLATLIAVDKVVRSHGGKLKLRGLNSDLMDIMRTCALDKLFDIEA